jgi:hypothetical protein
LRSTGEFNGAAIAVSDVRVFELDRPATRDRKIECIHSAVGLSATPVTYVPADFLTSTIEAMHRGAGFDFVAAVQRFAVSAHRSRPAASSYSRTSIAG